MSAVRMEEKRTDKNVCASSKSMESLYSLSSANSKSTMQRRKSLSIHSGNGLSVSKSSEVRQRVISARMLRFKNLQNQLADALQHISALSNENRLLKTLHKRQDTALAKYEGTNAELPQLLHSHAEELRIWSTKHRALSMRNRELNAQLKQKDEIILKLSERNKHLTQLNDDKNLECRDTLSGKVHYLELRLAEKDSEIQMLMRRNYLETKVFKVHLHNEQKKYKTLCQKLEKTPTKLHVPTGSDYGDEINKFKAKSNNSSLLPRKIQRKKNLTDEEDAPTTFRYTQKPMNEEYALKTCENHSSSGDDDDGEIVEKEIAHNRSWFPRQEYSEDEDLILKEIQSEETIEEKPLVSQFNEMSLNGDGDGYPIVIETNDCENSAEKCCSEEANDDVNEMAGGETNRTTVSGIGRPANCQIPRRLPMDPKKKNQLLAALKSIDSNKCSDQE